MGSPVARRDVASWGRWPYYLAALVVAVTGLFLALELRWPWSRVSAGVTRMLFRGTVVGVAAWFCIARSRREYGRARPGWLVFGLGVALGAIGQWGYAASMLARDTTALPELVPADALVSVAPFPVVVGLLLIAGRSPVTAKVVTVLDGLVITLSCLFVAWSLRLGSVPDRSSVAGTLRDLLTFKATSGVLLLALVLVIAMRWEGDLTTLVLLAAAMACWVASVLAANADPVSRLDPGPLVEWGATVPALLIAVAAARRGAEEEPGLAGSRRQWRLTLVLPTTCALAVIVAALVRAGTSPRFDPLLAWLAATVMVLIVLRMFVTLGENRSLTLHLEQRVEERTGELARTQERFASLVRNSSDVIGVIDSRGSVSYASPSVSSLLGYTEAEVLGREAAELIHPEDRPRALGVLSGVLRDESATATVGCRLQHRDGGWRHVETAVSVLRGDPDRGLVVNIRDVTDRMALEDLLRHEALHDSLTALANRRLFSDRVRHAADRVRRTRAELAVLFVDLDGFKRVNDSAGHAAGDQVLVGVAERLQDCLRPTDTAARFGGDEFAVLLEDTSAAEACEVAQRVVDSLGGVHLVGGQKIRAGASVGVVSASGAIDVESLLRDADVAMYQAKATGRGRYAVFHPHMREQLIEQMALETALGEAIERGGLRLLYQPIVDLTTGRTTGVEALVRWTDERHGSVPPSLFIPLAESSELIMALDVWVLEEATAHTRELHLRHPRHADLTVNVNVSAHHLRRGGLAEEVSQFLQGSQLPPDRLVLEITETAMLPDPTAVIPELQALHASGVQISLDDFGTGYSSLATLDLLPVDEIKVDRSFVEALGSGARGAGLVGAIVDMAHALDLNTVAEGVETAEQLRILRELRCATGQGYLFAPPLEPHQLDAVLAEAVPVGRGPG